MLALFALSLALQSPAHAEDLASKLRAFAQDPKGFQSSLPEHSGGSASLFSPADIQSGAYITLKNDKRPLDGRAKFKKNDRAEDLVDAGDQLVRRFDDLLADPLQTAEVTTRPWSDTYWPTYEGGIAFRYGDTKFPDEKTKWPAKLAYIQQNLANYSDVNALSPAEKYDLLVGDANHELTNQVLDESNSYYQSEGKIQKWMGICDGWSPASYSLARPSGAVTAMAADGHTQILFYPSDIKALADLLWHENSSDINFIGGRCDKKNPKTDPNGRIIDQDCFDTNPGTWHLAMLNQIGIAHRPFIMDATYDYQVWNQPLIGYDITYFNPQTMSPVKNAKKATIDRASFTQDRFASYRSKDAVKLVGVSMVVRYGTETDPTARLVDNETFDDTETVTYLYDLELDADDNIIGGEWYYNAHPDFLWTPPKGSRALSPGDTQLIASGLDSAAWDGRAPLPAEWQKVAQATAAQGSPIALVVENLVRLANHQ